jgi:hypothetical protein
VGSLRSLAQQLHQFAVKFVDFLTPVGNVHRTLSALTSTRKPKSVAQPDRDSNPTESSFVR